MKLNKLFRLLCVGAAMSMLAAPAGARELKLGVGLAPSHSIYWGLDQFAKAVKERSGGELEMKLFPLSLMSTGQMLGGIRDGAVDAGLVLPQQFPSELPEAQMLIDLAMLGTNSYAMAGAVSEYMFSCQDCLDELLKYNQVYLGGSSTAPYSILSTKKISTEEELAGAKLRSGAAPWARWATSMGAVALTLPGNSVFEAVSAGTIDGAMMATAELSSIRLVDVVKHITLGVPNGTYHRQDINNFNRDVWKSLPEAQRRLLLDASALSVAAATWKMADDSARDLKEAETKGIQVHQAAPELVAKSQSFVESDLLEIGQNAEKNNGIKDASGKIARFRELVDKWEKLVPQDRSWEIDELADVYQREIFSKIDASTYGL